MDYIFVLLALGSMGTIFAGVKTFTGKKKQLTRLEIQP
jgi:hypothetical protein